MVSYAKSNELTFAIHKPSVTCDLWSVNFKFVVSKFFHSFQLYPNKWDSRTVFRCADYETPRKKQQQPQNLESNLFGLLTDSQRT